MNIKFGINRLFNLFKTTDEHSNLEYSELEEYPEIKKDRNEIQQALSPEINNLIDYYGIIFQPISTNKTARLRTYRQISTYPEISFALDETATSFLTTDDNGEFIKCEIAEDKNIDDDTKEKINKEFKRIVELFDFPTNSYTYIHKFLTEGELCFENIVKPENVSLGIIGVRELPNETYEYLINGLSQELIGIAYIKEKQNPQDAFYNTTALMNNATFGRTNLNNQYNTPGGFKVSQQYDKMEFIPVPWSQITYISSGNMNPEKTIMFPLLEKIRKTYIQLVLLEECAIVYRVARSPERLVFNVATGKLPRQKAEQELLKLMMRFRNRKKGGNGSDGKISNGYDAVNALESYFFIKPDGGDQTTVEKLAGSASFSELGDIEYFQKKLYLGLNVPFSRLNKSDSDYKQFFGENSQLSYEEFRFAKHIIRTQQAFACGVKDALITHLKLIGFWEKYKLDPHKINVEFVKPSIYELFIQQQLLKIKTNNYKELAGNEEFSKSYLQEKYLKMSKEEISKNRIKRIDDAIFEARVAKLSSKHGGSMPQGMDDFGSDLGTIAGPRPGGESGALETPPELESPPEMGEQPNVSAPGEVPPAENAEASLDELTP